MIRTLQRLIIWSKLPNYLTIFALYMSFLTLGQSAPYTSQPYGSIVKEQELQRNINSVQTSSRSSRLKLSSDHIYNVLNFISKLPNKEHVAWKRTNFDLHRNSAKPVSEFRARKRPEEVRCPAAEDGIKQFACATPNELDEYRCIDDHMLCDHEQHCPNGEDEDPTVCMFHRMTMNYFKVLLDAVLGLTHSIV